MLGLLLVGGILATPPPGVVRLKTIKVEGNRTITGHCTATVMRDKSVYTAAHCTLDGVSEFELSGTKHKVRWVDVDHNRDVAIGETIPQVSVDTSRFMILGDAPKTGDFIRVGGFGCHTKQYDMDFKYREGKALVSGLTSNGYMFEGPVYVCSGDSGGPAFINGRLIGVISSYLPWETSFISLP